MSIMVWHRWTSSPLETMCLGFFSFLSFLEVVYYGMHATAAAGVLWSVHARGRGCVTMTTGLLRGLALLVERGRSVRACLGVVCVCARARGGGGGGRLSIMVCPLRGNYAESYASVGGGGIIMGCLPPLCVCEDVS